MALLERPAHNEIRPQPVGLEVEIAWRSFHSLNRSFVEGGERYLDLLHPDVEWIPIMSLTDGRTYRGHDGVREWMENARTLWRVHRTPWREMHAVGHGRVLALGRWECIGRQGGVEVRFDHAAWLMDVRDDLITRLEAFADTGEALDAAWDWPRPEHLAA